MPLSLKARSRELVIRNLARGRELVELEVDDTLAAVDADRDGREVRDMDPESPPPNPGGCPRY